nr:hypothetical protein BaRGS_006558 [Batillaria attramentaria]
MGYTKNKEGEISLARSVVAGALAGCVGSSVASPFYMVKTHLQAQAVKEIAVGFQHPHGSMSEGFRAIYSEHGMPGLWRGVSGAIARVTVGSAAQLSTFSYTKQIVVKSKIFHQDSWLNALAASMLSGEKNKADGTETVRVELRLVSAEFVLYNFKYLDKMDLYNVPF